MNGLQEEAMKHVEAQSFKAPVPNAIAALARSLFLTSIVAAFLYLVVSEYNSLIQSDPLALIEWSAGAMAISLTAACLLFIPLFLYAWLLALPVYRYLAVRLTFTLAASCFAAMCFASPIPLVIGRAGLAAVPMFAMSGLLCGALFFYFEQSSRRMQKRRS
jgi:hypothetical protein